MSDKFKKRVRALAAELNIPYQAAFNMLVQGTGSGSGRRKVTEETAKDVLFRTQCMMIECWGPVDTFNWATSLSFTDGLPHFQLLGVTASDPDELLQLVSRKVPAKRPLRPIADAYVRPKDLESASARVDWLPDAIRAAHLRSFFWALEELGPVIEPLLSRPWHAIRHGEVYDGQRSVCFVHPVRMNIVTRVMDGKEITDEEATYMTKAYGPDWHTLGPEWTSRLYEQ